MQHSTPSPSMPLHTLPRRGPSLRLRQGLNLGMGLIAAAVLAACGGSAASTAPNPSTPLIPGVALQISGTAATGAAMAGASVAIQCATGAQTITASATGSYSATLAAASLPCLVEASSVDGTNMLHSVAAGSGAAASAIVANVTPITELVTAQALGSSDTAGAFRNYRNAAHRPGMLQALTADTVNTALNTVKTQIAALDTAATLVRFNPLTDAFTAATSGIAGSAATAGDSNDQLLDALVAALRQASPGSASATEAVQAFAAALNPSAKPVTGADAQPTTNSATITTDITAYMAPPVPSCPVVRNAAYRVVGMGGSTGKTSLIDWRSGQFSTTWRSGLTENMSFQFDKDAPCQYRFSSSRNTLSGVASAGGVLIIRDPGSAVTPPGYAIALPQQNLTLADLAGTWNFLEYSPADESGFSAWANDISRITFDGTGRVTQAEDCSGITRAQDSCSPMTASRRPTALIKVNEGEFATVGESGLPGNSQVFAFRNAAGAAMMVVSSGNGGILFGSHAVEPLKLPAVGQKGRFWDIRASVGTDINSTLSFDVLQNTVVSADTDTSTVTRVRDELNGQPDGQVDSVVYNQPRAGLRFRPAGSYVLNGVTQSHGDAIQMPIPGLGLTIGAGPGGGNPSQFLEFSIALP